MRSVLIFKEANDISIIVSSPEIIGKLKEGVIFLVKQFQHLLVNADSFR